MANAAATTGCRSPRRASRAAGFKPGSERRVLVFSDGADTASTKSLATLRRRARRRQAARGHGRASRPTRGMTELTAYADRSGGRTVQARDASAVAEGVQRGRPSFSVVLAVAATGAERARRRRRPRCRSTVEGTALRAQAHGRHSPGRSTLPRCRNRHRSAGCPTGWRTPRRRGLPRRPDRGPRRWPGRARAKHDRIRQIAHFGPARTAPAAARRERRPPAASSPARRWPRPHRWCGRAAWSSASRMRLEQAGMRLEAAGVGAAASVRDDHAGLAAVPGRRLDRRRPRAWCSAGSSRCSTGSIRVDRRSRAVRRAAAGRAAARRSDRCGRGSRCRRPWTSLVRESPDRWPPSSVGRWPSTGSGPTSPTRWSGWLAHRERRPRVGGHGGAHPARGRRQPRRGAADHRGHDARAGPAAPARACALRRGPAVGLGPDRPADRCWPRFMFVFRREYLTPLVTERIGHRACSWSGWCCSCSASSG